MRPWRQSLKFPVLGLKPTNEGSVSAIYSLPYQISVASQIDPGVSPYMFENASPWGIYCRVVAHVHSCYDLAFPSIWSILQFQVKRKLLK